MTLLVLATFGVSGCLVQSDIQGRYVEDRAECRGSAESAVNNSEQAAAATKKERDARLVTMFSDCMGKQGWQVAKPKKQIATTYGPAGPLDPYPRGGFATMSAPAGATAVPMEPTQAPVGQQPVQPATQAPVGQAPVQTQSSVLSPAPGQAPLSAPAEAPAMYQPARPVATPTPSYGSGAGRNF